VVRAHIPKERGRKKIKIQIYIGKREMYLGKGKVHITYVGPI